MSTMKTETQINEADNTPTDYSYILAAVQTGRIMARELTGKDSADSNLMEMALLKIEQAGVNPDRACNRHAALVDMLKTSRAAVYEFTRSSLIDAGNSRPGSGLLAHNNPVILEIDELLRGIDPSCAEVVCGDKARALLTTTPPAKA